jgi:hypothetical protein
MKRQLSEQEVSGMTLNERLYLSGLLDDFDKAITQQNAEELKHILERVYISFEDIDFIIKQLLK